MEKDTCIKYGLRPYRYHMECGAMQIDYYSNVLFQATRPVLVLMIVLARLMSCLAGKKKTNMYLPAHWLL